MINSPSAKPDREPDYQFHSFEHWVNKGLSWLAGTNPLCLDTKNRRMRNGGDFRLSQEEDCYPVSVWYGLGGQTKAEQTKSIRNSRAALKANYPWRY